MDENQDKIAKKKNKSTIVLTTLLIIIILASSGIGLYAWAKYITSKNGSAQAPMAKWRFELKDGITQTANQIDFPLTRTDNNQQIDSGCIAPGTWGEIPITVVTTGTEVHMKYDLNISIENCPTNLKFYKDANHKKEFTTIRTGTGEEGSPKVATVTIEKYIDKNSHNINNGEHEQVIYWYWPYETGKGNQIEANDLIDSADMNKTVTMAIAATGMQVTEVLPDPDAPVTTLYASLYDGNTLVLSSKKDMEYEGTLTTSYNNGNSIYDWPETSTPVWFEDRFAITKVVIKDRITPKSTYYWFMHFKLTSLDISGLDTGNVTNMSHMFNCYSGLTSLDVSGLDTGNVTDMSYMFSSCTGLTSLDVSGLDTGNVTNMNSMFRDCTGLTSLDVSGFDTGNVTNMNSMFRDCTGLTSLDVSGFDTGNVTDMSSMFRDCTGLTSLDVSGFDTGNVTNMNSMFRDCTGLTSLDVSGFDTGNVTNMYSMFRYCTGLTSLDVSGFDTGNVTNMNSMFRDCTGLTSLDVSGFDTGNVTDMSSMFRDCTGLTSLDVSGFDTGNVTDMSSMFRDCTGLTSLDVSGFDTGNVTNMSYMFRGCSRLKTIYSSERFTTDKVTSSSSMFYNCTKLKGGNGTNYKSSKTDKEYARIDTTETPGYFTRKTN